MTITSLYATSQLDGDVSTPGAVIGAPDGVWTTDVDNTNWTARYAIDNLPAGQKLDGTQTINVFVRKETGTGTPTFAVELWENGVLVIELFNAGVDSLTGVNVGGTFNASAIGDPSDVEVRLVGTGTGGPPTARTTPQVDAITWVASHIDIPVVTAEQTVWRFRYDDFGETDATWVDATDTAIGIEADFIFRVRFAALSSGAGDNVFRLFRKVDAGTFAEIAVGSTGIEAALTSAVTDGQPTTQQITAGAFSPGKVVVGTGASNLITFTAASSTEIEYVVRIPAGTAIDTTLELQLRDSAGAPLTAYGTACTLTVAEPPPPPTEPGVYFDYYPDVYSNEGELPTELVVADAIHGHTVDSLALVVPLVLDFDIINARDLVFGFAEYEGLTGGQGQTLFTVTTTADSGAGSYRDALSAGNRYIVFDEAIWGSTIALATSVTCAANNVTVDAVGTDIKATTDVTRFEGTNIVVAGLHFLNNNISVTTDCATVRNAPAGGQVVGFYGCTFEGGGDAGLDVIWNLGNDVKVTVAMCRFYRMGRGSLVNSGNAANEGGSYEITFALCWWDDMNQRMPLARDVHYHQYNNLVERYGDAVGAGGGSRIGENVAAPIGWVSSGLLESNVAFPRDIGELTWTGATVTNAREDWASPNATALAEEIIGTHLMTNGATTAVETSQGTAFVPPYTYDLVPANAALRTFIQAIAGAPNAKRNPFGGNASINPSASFVYLHEGETVTVKTADEAITGVELFLGATSLGAMTETAVDNWELAVTALPAVGSTDTLHAVATTAAGSDTSPTYQALIVAPQVNELTISDTAHTHSADNITLGTGAPGPTLRGSGTSAASTYGTGVTVARPAGLTTDDVVIIALRVEVATDPDFACTGFEQVLELTNSENNNTGLTVLKGTGQTAGGDFTITSPTLASGDWVARTCTAWADADPSIVAGTAFAGMPTGGVVTVPSITTTEDDAEILLVGAQTFGGYTSSVPAFADVASNGGCFQRSRTQATAGSTGTVAITTTHEFSSTVALQIALQPVSVAGDLIISNATHAHTADNIGIPFDVVAGRIRTPDGLTFVPAGVNTSIKITSWAYVFEHPSNLGTISSYEADPVTYPSHVTEAQTWGFDLLRCNLIVVNNDAGGPNPNDPALLADLIEHGVNELLAGGFVVMLTSMDFTGSANVVLSGGTVDLGVRSFYAACLTKWKDNPNFWINPYNEPYADGTPALTNWTDLHTNMIDFLRAEGYTGPIVCDLPRFGQGIDNLADGDLDVFAAHDPGIVFGWHAYGVADGDLGITNTWQSHEDEAVAAKARGHAVLIGECGVANPPSSGAGPWQVNEVGFGWAMDRATDLDIGVVWWHGFHDEYQLRTDGLPFWNTTDGTGLTTFGEEFWSYTHSLVVADSNHTLHSTDAITLVQTNELVVDDSIHEHTVESAALVQVHALSVSDSTHTHGVDIVSLTQTSDLVVAGAAHNHSTDSVTLTQIHDLFVANTAHGHTADSTVLSQVHGLTIVGASHEQVADGLLLVQTHVLAISNTAHTHTAVNVALTQLHQLATNNTVHAHTGQSPAITTEGSLGIDEALHAHKSDTPTMSVIGDLEIQGATHAHTADAVNLSVAGDLVVSDAVHTHVVDDPSITQVHELTIADILHDHIATSPSPTQVHVLTVDAADHTQTSENVGIAQTHVLAVQDDQHDHVSGTFELIQVHVLAAETALHGHTATNIAIAVEGSLGITESLHGVTSDPLTLTQVHLLGVQSAAHGHATENVILVQEFQLAIDNAQHGHAVDEALLAQIHMLTIASAQHDLVSDMLALGQTHVLGVANAAHDHLAASIVVELTTVTLVLQSALHLHLATNSDAYLPDLDVQDAMHDHIATELILRLTTMTAFFGDIPATIYYGDTLVENVFWEPVG